MNEIVARAKELQIDVYKGYLPELEVGEEVTMNDLWDGVGEVPEESYSIKLTDYGMDGNSNVPVWINYEFDIIEENENPLDIVIKITGIELL